MKLLYLNTATFLHRLLWTHRKKKNSVNLEQTRLRHTASDVCNHQPCSRFYLKSSSELCDWCLFSPLKQRSAPVIRLYISLMSSHSASKWFVASYERDANIWRRGKGKGWRLQKSADVFCLHHHLTLLSVIIGYQQVSDRNKSRLERK